MATGVQEDGGMEGLAWSRVRRVVVVTEFRCARVRG